MKDAYIVDGIRTPIGSFRGTLSNVRTDDLAAIPLRYMIEQYPFLTEMTDDVIMGCANQAGEDNRNVARMALLLAGLSHKVPGETVNRLCASGMSSVNHARRSILSGEGDIFMAGGVEHMTRGPFVISKSAFPYGNDAQLYDSSFGWRFINPKMAAMYGTEAMGETAENLAVKYNISREEQDLFAYQSQAKASIAQINGRLDKEVTSVEVPINKKENTIFSKDEFLKPKTTLEVLATLRPAFRKENGTVTAGNSSGLNDGAAALLIMSEEGIKWHSLQPMARIVSSGVAGVEPRIMGIGPVYASEIALKRAGLSIEEMDIIEINEAFSVQVLACLKEMHVDFNDTRVNPNGGAIALGHPLGMTGARILLSAAMELNMTGKRFALVTMCIGVGQGYAVVLENARL